ncbi:MAG TPA: thioredoxin domain-containing protein [Halanaerobiales bacterium]|nr:thioredoxin domain-containing protein [Halanaerobiales bacterium]
MNKTTNKLINEKSPYLLQHAHNPVNWYSWNEEAFKQAKKKDRPVFLSIGYSTCHWCHVMARESFEDEEIAAIFNENFIPVKVDREERPDIDSIYMRVCQLMTGSGGWPLSIFMTPDKKPFYAATYIPKNSKAGMAGLLDLLPQIIEQWENNRNKTITIADQMTAALQDMEVKNPGKNLNENIFTKTYTELERYYDSTYGGFGHAPKFPTPHQLIFLLHYWHRYNKKNALKMVEKTLQSMRAGGIFDQIGYGFHRYSTDKKWLVPHFEKMLYDQALLINAYIDGFQATGNKLYAETAEDIITYVKRELLSAEGGFYSAEDADSEGVEGKFYLWNLEEIRKHFSPAETELIIEHYRLKADGNSIPHLDPVNLDNKNKEIESLRKRLFEIRERRVHPHKDDKILTDWNGLMLAALAQSGRILDNEEYIKLASAAANFIMEKLQPAAGQLLHRYRDGSSAIPGNLDDYSFFILGLIELYQSTFNSYYLDKALRFNQSLLKNFWNESNPGFFFTSKKREKLLSREMKIYDGAIPSGNSIAIWNIIRLAHLTGQIKLEKIAEKMTRTFSETIVNSPSSHCQFLSGFDALLGPFHDLILSGNKENTDFQKFLEVLNSNYLPNKVIIHRPQNIEDMQVKEMIEYLKDYGAIENRATVYVCRDYTCQLPTTDTRKFQELIQ